MKKKLVKIIAAVIGGVVLVAAAGIGVLSATEYRPAPQQKAEKIHLVNTETPAKKSLTVCTWNIGYGGLGKDSDFFMDGGKMVYPPSANAIEDNLSAISDLMCTHPADAWMVQEVDVRSARTGNMDEFERLQSTLGFNGALAYNYNCLFVPFPLPPIGRVQTGVATFTDFQIDSEPQRIALHCPFTWPVRAANMKRCLLVTRSEVEGTDKELVLVNLHLEAYESGEGRIAQTKELMSLLEAEYAKGNYVIAGGDFNQGFPGSMDVYPIKNAQAWTPGQLEEEMLPEGWRYVTDSSNATCRLLDAPLSEETQLYVIDGFILSPNVETVFVQTIPLQFEHSDHNPVQLQVNLL